MSESSPSGGRFRQRRIPALLGLLIALLVAAADARAAKEFLYVGTYTGAGSQGIYAYRFDPGTGRASPVGLVAATENPSFIAVDPKGRFLYAVNELETFRGKPSGAVSVFAIDRETGRLTLRQQVSSLGAGPAHLSLDRSGRFLLVANYNGGSVAVFPIGEDGRLGPRTAFVQNAGSSVNPERQSGPHAHFVQATPDNRFAITADLGLDQLLIHRFDAGTGSLAPATPAFATVAPGAGPRHIAFAPSGKILYVVNELASTVTVFAFEPDAGTLRAIQSLPTLPRGFAGTNTAAEIAVDARGRFLYVSNRGHDSIAVFAIAPGQGTLTPLEHVPSGGRTPRHLALDPTGRWLFAANQGSDSVTLFRVDRKTGRLRPAGRPLSVTSPVCVQFVVLDQEP